MSGTQITGVKRWAVHSHVGVYWDGGVQLLGIYRFWWVARLKCWWYVRVENQMGLATVRTIRADAKLSNYCSNQKEWFKEMESAELKTTS